MTCMRQIVLDTETTGLEVAQGHRIIEIGCVELRNRRATGSHFHRYLNPDRDVDAGARAVHGLSREDLAGKPRFAEIADEFIQFISGAELIIHNASFDVGFLDAELARLPGEPPLRVDTLCQVLDTLGMARAMHPGQRNNLDALCKRYGIDNSHRELHGALLDARILTDVYLAMTGGQSALALDQEAPHRATGSGGATAAGRPPELNLRVLHASATERAAHEQLQEVLQKESHGRCLWSNQ
jgi:DNA polymerase III subunit epsilon